MAHHGIVVKLLWLSGGFLVWALHLTLVYGFNALACARLFTGTAASGTSVIQLVVLAVTVVAIGLNVAILIAALLGRGPGIDDEPDPETRHFWRYLTALAAGFSVIAVIWAGLPVLLVAGCS